MEDARRKRRATGTKDILKQRGLALQSCVLLVSPVPGILAEPKASVEYCGQNQSAACVLQNSTASLGNVHYLHERNIISLCHSMNKVLAFIYLLKQSSGEAPVLPFIRMSAINSLPSRR